MKTLAALLATLTLAALMPSQALAQRRGSSNGTVNTPFGQFSSSDMRAAGGDPFAAESIRDQRNAMLYEQQQMKQQQLYMQQVAKQQKARQDYLKAHPEVAKAELEAQSAAKAKAIADAAARKKPRPSGKAMSSSSAKAASKTAKDATKTAKDSPASTPAK